MNDSLPEVEALALAYLRCSDELMRKDQDPDGGWEPKTNGDQRAYELIGEAIRNGPARPAWALVVAVLRLAPDERLDVYAAGPLEDLVRHHGDELLPLIEAEATRDERFRWALGEIWLMGDYWPLPILERLVRASEGRLKVLDWYPRLPSTEADS